ncbi:MAG: 1,3-beta-glucanosyltransferase gas1 [Phylliscum demangeonii]|nr:MAG: 1,3-beta-glucanosyltransferase gas1 [Phylliscum demangeonii]
MKARSLLPAAVATIALFASAVLADVDPIVIKGSKFFYKSNGTEFFIKGVAYQQNFNGNGSASSTTDSNAYTDPLADVASCTRDVPLLRELKANTIRVYAIDPSKDHSQCMRMLQDAGIYVVSDLSQPGLSINRDSPSWDDQLYARYVSVIDEMVKYNNVIGFFAGNEVANAANNTQATPFVKAAVRDMKAYIKQRNYRPMGVGYATSDDAAIRENLADYFNCGPTDSSIDFWGYNIYSWCGQSDYQTSGYADRTKAFADYSVPVFFAEYGCNVPKPRRFDEVQALYGPQMSPVWSGGIVYMYFQEENDYGLVTVSGSTASKLPDYTALSSQLAQVTPTAVNQASYAPTNTQARACPPTGAGWNASATLPPTPNKDLCGCAMKNLTCVAKAGITTESVGQLFGTVCGLDKSACAGIVADGSTGTYGALSMCNATEKLSWVFNAYYLHQSPSNRASACDFGGNAVTQQPSTPSGTCKDLLSQAGAAATGSVSSTPTAGGSGGSSSGGGSGSGSGSGSAASPSATKKGAAGAVTVPVVDVGLVKLGVSLLGAVGTGVGLILL